MPWISGGSGGGAGIETLIGTIARATTGTVDFTSIPATFNHLKVILVARGNNASATDILTVGFNGDVGANYYTEQARAVNGSTAAAIEQLAGNSASLAPSFPAASAALANAFGCAVLWIPGYASTTWLKSFTLTVFSPVSTVSGNVYSAVAGGVWNSTAAINRVRITTNADVFAVGSTGWLYGIN